MLDASSTVLELLSVLLIRVLWSLLCVVLAVWHLMELLHLWLGLVILLELLVDLIDLRGRLIYIEMLLLLNALPRLLMLVLLLLLGVSGLLSYILLLLMLLEHHVLGVVELLLLLLLLLLELLLLLIGEMVVLARKVGLLLLLVWRTLGNLLHLTHFLIHLLT